MKNIYLMLPLVKDNYIPNFNENNKFSYIHIENKIIRSNQSKNYHK